MFMAYSSARNARAAIARLKQTLTALEIPPAALVSESPSGWVFLMRCEQRALRVLAPRDHPIPDGARTVSPLLGAVNLALVMAQHHLVRILCSPVNGWENAENRNQQRLNAAIGGVLAWLEPRYWPQPRLGVRRAARCPPTADAIRAATECERSRP
jgi:hypothetical protein